MRDLAKVAVCLLACTLSAGCRQLAKPSASPVPARRAVLVGKDVLAEAGLEYYWRFRLKLNSGERIARVYRLDGNFYCVTNRRRLIAVDAQRGVPKWAYVIGRKGEAIFRPAHGDGVALRDQRDGMLEMLHPKRAKPPAKFDAVMINTISSLNVLDRTTGRQVRVIDLGFAANTGGATDGINFYAASTKGHYHAIRLDAEVETWTMSTSDVITAPVEYYDNVVYVGSHDKSMCAAVGRLHRKLLWRRDFGAPIASQFHVDRRGCFLGTLNGQIHLLDRTTGKRIKIPDKEIKAFKDWGPFVCNGQIMDPIQVGKKTIFQRARQDKFYAINISTGEPRWTHPDGRVVLAVIAGDVYLLDKNRILLIVDEGTGKIKTSVPMTGGELFVPNTSLPAIYGAARDGMLCCIRPKGSGHLTAKMLNPRIMAKPAPAKPAASMPAKE